MNRRDAFHPLRFLKHKPWGAKLRALFETAGEAALGEPLLQKTFDLVGRNGGPAFRNPHVGNGNGDSSEAVMDLIYAELETSLTVGRWLAAGRNIFSFDAVLTDMLSRTELDDVRISELKLPFDNFYIHFEGDTFLSMPGEANAIDGVYIHRWPDVLTITATSHLACSDTAHGFARSLARSRKFTMMLKSSTGNETLQELLEAFVVEKTAELRALPKIATAEVQAIAGSEGIHVDDLRQPGRDSRISFLEAGLPAFSKLLGLTANALCYLSFVPSAAEVEPAYPEDAPANLLADVNARRPAIREVARSELRRRGFSKIRFLTAADQEREPSAGLHAREVLPHHRRAHWRRRFDLDRQVVGRSWIRPTIVRSDKGTPAHGHIYEVNA